MTTVFISYSHKDETWKDQLLPQLESLVQAGVEMKVWQDRKIDGGNKWYPEILEAMGNSAAAILLISANFLSSKFCVQDEVPALLKRQEEEGMLLIPVLVKPCPWKAHRWLKDRQMIPRDGKCVAVNFPGDLAAEVFAAVAEQVLAHFEQLAARGPATAAASPALIQRLAAVPKKAADRDIVPPAPVVPWPALPAGSIDLTRLPETGSALFGRDEELGLLDDAWASAAQTDAARVRILAFTAHGGVGKSTLLNHWLAEMARDHFRGATRVFGWSFYSQGVRAETAASADAFIDAALRFFGDADPAAGAPWDKGARLASLVGRERALLVLDGLEPLQSPHVFERGKLRDPALESLLRSLARHAAGLCLVTTRESLPDLAGRPGVTTRDLEQISSQAGRALLRTARVVGTDAELEALAGRFGPHALAVSLLGVYLREHPGHGIGPASALERLPGSKPIDRVLAGFEQWLGDAPEREALRLLGFFDRPADAGCLRVLRDAPSIPGLNTLLTGVSDTEWDRLLTRLEKLRLIHRQETPSGQFTVDAHPLIREHFAELLKGGEIWREGHRRLYEHLCATTPDQPDATLEDLQPLYQAVAHGCQAGLQQETCNSVYSARIWRSAQEAYSTNKLGAFGSDLGAISWFFERTWGAVSSVFSDAEQAWLLNHAAIRLRALGRLTEAIEPIRAAATWAAAKEDWLHAAIGAKNLSELELTLGDVEVAVSEAQQSVTYADRSGRTYMRILTRSTHADALHMAGRRAEAKACFIETERMQRDTDHKYPLLYSVGGFGHCELLLADSEKVAWLLSCYSGLQPNAANVGITAKPNDITAHKATLQAVSQHASQTLAWSLNEFAFGPFSIALDRLTLGRAALYAAILEHSDVQNLPQLDDAVADLRRSGKMDYLPRALLTSAWQRRLTGALTGPESAQSDLNEACEIAERGPMRLHLADIHLHRARLFFRETQYPWESPQADLAAARRLIEKCGYWRRKEELEDAEAAILST